MARGFTPIIGLAVVVALALAAVFGAMSLSTNSAFAQANTAPSVKSTDKEPVTVYNGAWSEAIEVAQYFNSGTGTGEITGYTAQSVGGSIANVATGICSEAIRQ